MKKINLLYLIVIPVLGSILYISWNYAQTTAMFYGFAENKETEINHDHPVLIRKVYVTPGQFVNEGELLMEVMHTRYDQKITNLALEMEVRKIGMEEKKNQLIYDIQNLEAERDAKTNELQAQITRLQAESDLNKSLLKDLKSLDTPKKPDGKTPNEIKMESLQQELEFSRNAFDLSIRQLKAELKSVQDPQMIMLKQLEDEKKYYETEQEKHYIKAPSDGLIGNVHCREGENVSSFNTLVSFYERNPTLVKGYVHENLIVHVNVGDTLTVSSSLHPEHSIYGIVSGLGSRIVEIPERLRKMPEIKTYGREVLIQIPADNPFLQKEKVILEFLHQDGISTSLWSPITDRNRSSSNPGPAKSFSTGK